MDEEEALNAAGPSTPTSQPDGQPLSKNQLKKQAKRARFQELKLEKRVHEKERRRERQKALKEGYAAGTLSPAEQAVVERRRELLRARKAASKGQEADVYPGAIVIDLGFDDLMTDGEITSMASQLTYVYSVNKSAKRPFAAVLHTSFGPETTPRLWEKLGKSMWSRWVRMHFWEQGLDVLADVMRKGEQEAVEEKETGTAGTSEENESSTEAHDGEADLRKALTGPKLPHTIPASSQLVYLSADADEELTTLSPNEVYVIGGIVDRNRHKMLCQNKAEKLGIRTARLPIGSFIDNLPTRKVLTVNQVFEILVQYNVQGDWKAAFETVIPSRKFYTGREEKTAANRAQKERSETVEGDERDESVVEEEQEGDDVVMDEEAAVNEGGP